MIGFARLTALIFVLLGVVVILVGGAVAFGIFLRLPASMPNGAGVPVYTNAVLGGVIAFQGLVLAAIGQVLWLMAAMVERSQLSVEYLAEVVNRLGNVSR